VQPAVPERVPRPGLLLVVVGPPAGEGLLELAHAGPELPPQAGKWLRTEDQEHAAEQDDQLEWSDVGHGAKGTSPGVQIRWTHSDTMFKWAGRYADDAARGTHGERSPHPPPRPARRPALRQDDRGRLLRGAADRRGRP